MTDTPAQLQEKLASRDFMKAFMTAHGSAAYWSWRRDALASLQANRQLKEMQASQSFNTDFEALLTAYNLLHTLSREADLDPSERHIIHNLKTYIHTRSTP